MRVHFAAKHPSASPGFAPAAGYLLRLGPICLWQHETGWLHTGADLIIRL